MFHASHGRDDVAPHVGRDPAYPTGTAARANCTGAEEVAQGSWKLGQRWCEGMMPVARPSMRSSVSVCEDECTIEDPGLRSVPQGWWPGAIRVGLKPSQCLPEGKMKTRVTP